MEPPTPLQAPSFTNFQFQSIGKEPELLKRMRVPDTGEQQFSPSRTSSPSQDHIPLDVKPLRPLARPSLFQALAGESRDEAEAPVSTHLGNDMDVDMSSSSHDMSIQSPASHPHGLNALTQSPQISSGVTSQYIDSTPQAPPLAQVQVTTAVTCDPSSQRVFKPDPSLTPSISSMQLQYPDPTRSPTPRKPDITLDASRPTPTPESHPRLSLGDRLPTLRALHTRLRSSMSLISDSGSSVNRAISLNQSALSQSETSLSVARHAESLAKEALNSAQVAWKAAQQGVQAAEQSNAHAQEALKIVEELHDTESARLDKLHSLNDDLDALGVWLSEHEEDVQASTERREAQMPSHVPQAIPSATSLPHGDPPSTSIPSAPTAATTSHSSTSNSSLSTVALAQSAITAGASATGRRISRVEHFAAKLAMAQADVERYQAELDEAERLKTLREEEERARLAKKAEMEARLKREKEEAERRSREQAEAEIARKEREEAARKDAEETARKAKEEAVRKAKEEAVRKAKEEAARKAKEEAARKAKEEAIRQAQEEAARKAKKEEAARKAMEEAVRKEKEEAARQERERKAKEARERELKEAEAARLREKEETERRVREAEEAAARRAKEEAERQAKDAEAQRLAKVAAENAERQRLADEERVKAQLVQRELMRKEVDEQRKRYFAEKHPSAQKSVASLKPQTQRPQPGPSGSQIGNVVAQKTVLATPVTATPTSSPSKPLSSGSKAPARSTQGPATLHNRKASDPVAASSGAVSSSQSGLPTPPSSAQALPQKPLSQADYTSSILHHAHQKQIGRTGQLPQATQSPATRTEGARRQPSLPAIAHIDTEVAATSSESSPQSPEASVHREGRDRGNLPVLRISDISPEAHIANTKDVRKAHGIDWQQQLNERAAKPNYDSDAPLAMSSSQLKKSTMVASKLPPTPDLPAAPKPRSSSNITPPSPAPTQAIPPQLSQSNSSNGLPKPTQPLPRKAQVLSSRNANLKKPPSDHPLPAVSTKAPPTSSTQPPLNRQHSTNKASRSDAKGASATPPPPPKSRPPTQPPPNLQATSIPPYSREAAPASGPSHVTKPSEAVYRAPSPIAPDDGFVDYYNYQEWNAGSRTPPPIDDRARTPPLVDPVIPPVHSHRSSQNGQVAGKKRKTPDDGEQRPTRPSKQANPPRHRVVDHWSPGATSGPKSRQNRPYPGGDYYSPRPGNDHYSPSPTDSTGSPSPFNAGPRPESRQSANAKAPQKKRARPSNREPGPSGAASRQSVGTQQQPVNRSLGERITAGPADTRHRPAYQDSQSFVAEKHVGYDVADSYTKPSLVSRLSSPKEKQRQRSKDNPDPKNSRRGAHNNTRGRGGGQLGLHRIDLQ
ncbi:hypothetical protein HGRIS_002913 [Hohenbuehelia grisea]|uniref:Uncharacterized protein n=1 Tax=Hohenbuehelia grisea TaxID=104357 RepID=A0ABR3JLW4_9AGAR